MKQAGTTTEQTAEQQAERPCTPRNQAAVPGNRIKIIIVDEDRHAPERLHKQATEGRKAEVDRTRGYQSLLGMSMISASETSTPARRREGCSPMSAASRFTKGSQEWRDKYEAVTPIILPSKVYEDVANQCPAIPLLPKSFHAKDDSPRSGGMFKFMKLAKFRGADHGRSRFREEASKIEKLALPEGVTIRKLFSVLNKPNQDVADDLQNADKSRPREPLLTPFGELVYQRSTFSKDMQQKQKINVPGYE